MGQKILVVEDNELNLKLFCDLLRAHGYAAEPVRDGREAIERARAFAPDLVVMDIQMPYISGLELIEQLKADSGLKHIPIMAVTAYAAKGDEERIRDAGAEGYVSKPISVMKFVAAVAALLDAAAARGLATAEPDERLTGEDSGEAAPAAADLDPAPQQAEIAFDRPGDAQWPASQQESVEDAAGPSADCEADPNGPDLGDDETSAAAPLADEQPRDEPEPDRQAGA